MSKIHNSQHVYVKDGKIRLGLSQHVIDEEQDTHEVITQYSVNLTAEEAVFLLVCLESSVEELVLGEKSRRIEDFERALLVCKELGIK